MHDHAHPHTHGDEGDLSVEGGPKVNFLAGFLGGIAGLSLVGLLVLVWMIFGHNKPLLVAAGPDAAPQQEAAPADNAAPAAEAPKGQAGTGSY